MTPRAHWRVHPWYRGSMRWFIHFTILSVAACAQQNPVFGVDDSGTAAGMTEASGDPSTEPGANTTSTTSPPPTTTMGPVDTGVDPTTMGLEETGVASTIETTMLAAPGTLDPMDTDPADSESMSDTLMSGTDTSTTDEPPPMLCMHTVNVLPNRLVSKDGLQIDCEQATTTFIGDMDQQGDIVLFYETKDCLNPVQDPVVYQFGSGWLPEMGIGADCVHATIRWDKAEDTCKIGSIAARKYVGDAPSDHVMIGVFFPTANDTPLTVGPAPYINCECPQDMPQCCNGKTPGDYKLKYNGVGAVPGGTADVVLENTPMKLHNYQAFVDDLCLIDQNQAVVHADWVAWRTPG